MTHPEDFRSLPRRYFSILALGTYTFKAVRELHLISAKLFTIGFRSGNTFRLTLLDKFPLRLGNVGENLKHKVGNQRSGKISVLFPCIQKLHVQHKNIRTDFLGNILPLNEDIIVISSQAVNAFDDDEISGFEPLHQFLICRSFKILPGLPAAINMFL